MSDQSLEAAAREMLREVYMHPGGDFSQELVTRAANFLTRLQQTTERRARDEALEEAAKKCDEFAALVRDGLKNAEGEGAACLRTSLQTATQLAEIFRALAAREPKAHHLWPTVRKREKGDARP